MSSSLRVRGPDPGSETKVPTESLTASLDLLVERIGDRVVERLTRTARPLLLRDSANATDGSVRVAKEIVVVTMLDPYLTLKAAHQYMGISVRSLRAALTDPVHPLPCYRPGGKGGKVLVRRSELDAWMERFRSVGEVDLDAMVEDVLRDVV